MFAVVGSLTRTSLCLTHVPSAFFLFIEMGTESTTLGPELEFGGGCGVGVGGWVEKIAAGRWVQTHNHSISNALPLAPDHIPFPCLLISYLWSISPWCREDSRNNNKRGTKETNTRAQELCESRGGCPGLPVHNIPYGLCGRNATLNLN